MLQQDHQEAQAEARRESLHRAYIDPDATDEIDRAVYAAMDAEPEGDDGSEEDDEC